VYRFKKIQYKYPVIFAFQRKAKMPPLFYKRGIKSKNPVLSLRGALANILSLRGALATKQSRFYKRGIKSKNITAVYIAGGMPPLFYKRGIKSKNPVLSLRGALATKQFNAEIASLRSQ